MPVPATIVVLIFGDVFVTVKEGYALVTLMPVPPVSITVLSGAVFVTVYVP
jgi:hypothetical protein